MTTIATLRAPWRGAALVLLLAAPGWAAPGWAQSPGPSAASPGILDGTPYASLGNPGPVGAVTGQPEHDTFGYLVSQACTPRPVLSPAPQVVGEVTGLDERDTYGFVVLGEAPCPPQGGR
ncbi:hypothetical protein VQH23_16835 [Pararoseomonas sp. SCSIO 73927]|uniref:hypothetical protein n=1 Tax=Pararoseomonas sp. SCSIO 73927 TaxID=3114537 RepID=UPI0030D111B6